MIIITENIKSYLKYSLRVLGVSNIYKPSSSHIVNALPSTSDSEKKKIINFYMWSDLNVIALDKSVFEKGVIRSVFVFFTTVNNFDNLLKDNAGMITKMHQALGGLDQQFLVGWLSPNSEIDFFSTVAELETPLRIVIYRDEVSSNPSIYKSGAHTILETLSPLTDINDMGRKRFVWNDFKRLLALP
jgi:hypothetical protein